MIFLSLYVCVSPKIFEPTNIFSLYIFIGSIFLASISLVLRQLCAAIADDLRRVRQAGAQRGPAVSSGQSGVKYVRLKQR